MVDPIKRKKEYDHIRYEKEKQTRKIRVEEWARNNPARIKEIKKKWRDNNKKYIQQHSFEKRKEVKLEVLTHYGKNNILICAWPGCEIQDLDMLTLDHIENDGAKHRQLIGGGGDIMYRKLRRDGFPSGFQTLCCNHQTKKELNRKRDNAVRKNLIQ